MHQGRFFEKGNKKASLFLLFFLFLFFPRSHLRHKGLFLNPFFMENLLLKVGVSLFLKASDAEIFLP